LSINYKSQTKGKVNGVNGRKYGINSGNAHRFTSEMLPPLEPNLTPFRTTNSDVLHLNIASLPEKIFLSQKRNKVKTLSKNRWKYLPKK